MRTRTARGPACLVVGLALGGPAIAAERIECPAGTGPSELTLAEGTEVWCARPDGTRHGPSQKQSTAGRILERGYWEDGAQQGKWRYYDAKGRIIRSGQMSAGQPTGAWTHFAGGSTPSATITHGAFDAPAEAPPQPNDPRYRWQLDLQGTPTAWWLIEPDAVAITRGTDRLVVVSIQTGAIEADLPLPAPLRPDLHVDGNQILGVTGPGELFIAELDPGGGGQWQRIRTPLGVTHALGVHGADEVVVRAGDGRFGGIDRVTGDATWSGALFMDGIRPMLVGSLAIGVRNGREVRAVTVGDGAFAWQARMPAPVLALGTGADQILAVLRGGTIQALDQTTGAPLWDLSVAVPAGVQPTWTTTGPDTWLTTPADAWRIDPIRGVVLDHRTAQPPEGQTAADLAVGRHHACTTGRKGGIQCTPGNWSLPTEAPALPPLLHDSTILFAAPSGHVVALDPALTTAIEAGTPVDAEVLVDEEMEVILEWQGERIAQSVPWVVVERDRPLEDCSVTTAAVRLPAPADHWDPIEATPGASPPLAPPPDPVLWIDDLILHDDLGEGVFTVHPDWETESAGTTWRMSWWHRHLPSLSTLMVTLGDSTDPADIDALVRCDGPPARFSGVAQLENGVRTYRISGRLEITPHPHSLDGEPGCLLDVALGGTDHGAWSSPVHPAWSEIVFEAYGDALPELDHDAFAVAIPTELSGLVRLDAYEPGALDRTEVLLEGVVDLRIDDLDPRGPILRAFSGTELLLEVPVPELTYGQVEVDDKARTVPVPTLEAHVHVARDLPLDTAPDAWRLLWTRSSCDADLEASVAAETTDDASELPEPTAEPAPPTARPAPLPPARSRWRRRRADTPAPAEGQ